MKKISYLLVVAALLCALAAPCLANAPSPRDQLNALGFDIVFEVDEREELLEDGFEYPISTVEVILTKGGEPTDFRSIIPGLIGSVYEFDDEYLAEAYNPPANAAAGVQAYYAGAGDQIIVSFDYAEGAVTVWYRMFYEIGPDLEWEDCFGEWMEMDSFVIVREDHA